MRARLQRDIERRAFRQCPACCKRLRFRMRFRMPGCVTPRPMMIGPPPSSRTITAPTEGLGHVRPKPAPAERKREVHEALVLIRAGHPATGFAALRAIAPASTVSRFRRQGRQRQCWHGRAPVRLLQYPSYLVRPEADMKRLPTADEDRRSIAAWFRILGATGGGRELQKARPRGCSPEDAIMVNMVTSRETLERNQWRQSGRPWPITNTTSRPLKS